MRGWPLRYQFYAPIHRFLTMLGSVRVLGRHPCMVVRNRMNRALFYLVFRDPTMRLRLTRRGFWIAVRSNDQAAASIIFNGDYSPREVDDAIRRTPRQATFVDVGANYGFMSLAMAHAVGCGVLAIEPNPTLVQCVNRSIAANPGVGDRIELVESACAAQPGVGRLSVSHRLTSNGHIGSRGMPVRVSTLDEVTKHKPGPLHLKIDVEGGEVAVLQGGKGALDRTSVVQCELSSREALDILEAAGFRARTLDGASVRSSTQRRIDLVFERAGPIR